MQHIKFPYVLSLMFGMHDIMVLVVSKFLLATWWTKSQMWISCCYPHHRVPGLTGPCSQHDMSQQLEQQI